MHAQKLSFSHVGWFQVHLTHCFIEIMKLIQFVVARVTELVLLDTLNVKYNAGFDRTDSKISRRYSSSF